MFLPFHLGTENPFQVRFFRSETVFSLIFLSGIGRHMSVPPSRCRCRRLAIFFGALRRFHASCVDLTHHASNPFGAMYTDSVHRTQIPCAPFIIRLILMSDYRDRSRLHGTSPVFEKIRSLTEFLFSNTVPSTVYFSAGAIHRLDFRFALAK